MALAGRIRSSLPLLNRSIRSDSLSPSGSVLPRTVLVSSTSEFLKNYSTGFAQKDAKVKPPVALFGGAGNYASALYVAAVKSNVLDKVETDILNFVEASKGSPKFSQFTKDLSVRPDLRVKALNEICTEAKFSDISKNFLVLLAEKGRLKNLDAITKKFVVLTMAHKGEVKVIVTSVIPLPQEEEKDLKETLQEILGAGTKVKLEQKIDPSILGGLVVEFGLKVFDMSIRTRARQMERFLREPVNAGL